MKDLTTRRAVDQDQNIQGRVLRHGPKVGAHQDLHGLLIPVLGERGRLDKLGYSSRRVIFEESPYVSDGDISWAGRCWSVFVAALQLKYHKTGSLRHFYPKEVQHVLMLIISHIAVDDEEILLAFPGHHSELENIS